MLVREPDRFRIPASGRRHRPLPHNHSRRRRHDRKHVLVPVRVDTNDVIHPICNHHY
jgi:hypothetical protein